MSIYITSMANELSELTKEIEDLKSLMNNGNTQGLPDNTWELLNVQLKIMIAYQVVLAKRLDMAISQ